MAFATVTTTQHAGASGVTVQVLYDATSSPYAESADAAATRNTVQRLVGHTLGSDASCLPFALAPPNADLSAETEAFLKQLTRTANTAAASVLCGSILAGHASDADDFGDVAVYLGLGDYGPSHERDVLRLFGLGNLPRLEGNGDTSPKTIQPIKLSSTTSIPLTVNAPPSGGSGEAIEELGRLLTRLEDRYAFCVPGRGVLVFYFLLGRYEASGWMGLAGIGVHS